MTENRCIDCGSDLTFHQLGCRFYTGAGVRANESGFAEMKRMEYLMSKAPCLARLNDLAAYAAKDDDDIQPQTK